MTSIERTNAAIAARFNGTVQDQLAIQVAKTHDEVQRGIISYEDGRQIVDRLFDYAIELAAKRNNS